eukprot:7377113-Prymnesium_polylepis.1
MKARAVGLAATGPVGDPDPVDDPPSIGKPMAAVFPAHELSAKRGYPNLLAASTASPLNIGPILIVYMSYEGTNPEATLDQ